jgi:hypothetical protein
MSLMSPTFDAQQLKEELVGRSYLLPTEIEVYIRNLVRIVDEQSKHLVAIQKEIDRLTPVVP